VGREVEILWGVHDQTYLSGDGLKNRLKIAQVREGPVFRSVGQYGRYKRRSKNRPYPKITQDALAAMIGTTRSRVSFFMNKVSETRLYRMQRPHPGQQVAAECDSKGPVAWPRLRECTPCGNRTGAI
jgi:hypothetical protein